MYLPLKLTIIQGWRRGSIVSLRTIQLLKCNNLSYLNEYSNPIGTCQRKRRDPKVDLTNPRPNQKPKRNRIQKPIDHRGPSNLNSIQRNRNPRHLTRNRWNSKIVRKRKNCLRKRVQIKNWKIEPNRKRLWETASWYSQDDWAG